MSFSGINKFKPINDNLIDKIWKRKIYNNKKKFFRLPNKCVSEGFEKKISRISNYLKKKGADFQFITASENNAWLLNIRGRDAQYTPIPHS